MISAAQPSDVTTNAVMVSTLSSRLPMILQNSITIPVSAAPTKQGAKMVPIACPITFSI